MAPIIDVLKRNKFYISTGNVNAWKELHRHNIANPSEELTACLKLQLQTVGEVVTDGTLSLSEEGSSGMCFCKQDLAGSTAITTALRSGVKITLKVFLQDWKPGHVNSCVESALSELKTDRLELLIVAFPAPAVPEDLAAEEDENQEEYPSLEQILPVWAEMERLVGAGKVIAIGVADLDVTQLGSLYDRATIKPTVDHYNIAACCTVPPELQLYAKEHDIQLLTHNDPSEFFPVEKVREVLEKGLRVSPDAASQWTALWVFRITAMVKTRSVITNKAYAVMLKKNVD